MPLANRRLVLQTAPLIGLTISGSARAQLSQSDASSGVRTVLEKGAVAAVEALLR